MENAICTTKTLAAAGETDVFRIAGGMIEVQGRVYGTGAVGATLTLYATNRKDDAASFKQVGQLVLAGNDNVLDTRQFSTAMAYGKIVVTAQTGTLDVSAGSSVGGATAALGTRSDTAATDDTGTWTFMALLKRALQNWTTLLTAVATGGVTVKSAAGTVVQAVVANGQSLSPEVDLGNARLGRIGVPSNIDSATKLTFQVATASGGTYRNLYDQYGTEYSVAVGVDRSVPVDVAMFASVRFLKVRMDTSAVPKAATANRTFDLSTLA